MNVGEGDRAIEHRRVRRARHLANIASTRSHHASALYFGVRRIDDQTNEPLRDTAVPSVQNPDDDLLADVAALGLADRPILDPQTHRRSSVVGRRSSA